MREYYIPTKEDYEKAENIMNEEEKKLSEKREGGIIFEKLMGPTKEPEIKYSVDKKSAENFKERENLKHRMIEQIRNDQLYQARNLIDRLSKSDRKIEEEVTRRVAAKIQNIIETLGLSQSALNKLGLERFYEKLEELKIVTCSGCGKKGEAYHVDSQEADNISTHSYENGEIWSGYGSKHDMTTHEWKGDPKLLGCICDDCIDSLRKDRAIEITDIGGCPFVDSSEYTQEKGNELSCEVFNVKDEGILEDVARGIYHPTESWLYVYYEEGGYLNKEIRDSIEKHLENCQECRLNLLKIKEDAEEMKKFSD